MGDTEPENGDGERLAFIVEAEADGQRLDAFLAARTGHLSRNRFKGLIKSGRVSAAGRTIEEPNYRVNVGETIQADVPPPDDPVPRPEAIDLVVVHEDPALIVIDKPAGLVVHPAAGNWTGTLVNALLYYCADELSGIGGVRRPGIVHRLDKDTTGLMVVAKTDAAHLSLSRQFADHGRSGPLERLYQALVWGVPPSARGTIDAPLGRDPRNRQKRAVVRAGGRSAVTTYSVIERYGAGEPVASRVECRLQTGRTHQIRAHMAHLGHPLIGDRDYGAGFQTKAATLGEPAAKAARRLRRQALHAAVLGFEHPVSGDVMRFESPPPDDMEALADALKAMT